MPETGRAGTPLGPTVLRFFAREHGSRAYRPQCSHLKIHESPCSQYGTRLLVRGQRQGSVDVERGVTPNPKENEHCKVPFP